MIKREVIAGPSCLTEAADDEPLFVLRANDPLAPMIVKHWAELYRHTKGDVYQMSDRQVRKYQSALGISAAMVHWARNR